MKGAGGAVSEQIRLQNVAPLKLERLFILGGKGLSEDDWRDNFEMFGEIDRISILTDKNTGEQKG